MIKTFADKRTRTLYLTQQGKGIHPELAARAVRRLDALDHATCIDDLRVPPSNRLEALKGDRKGQYSIRVNDQWRLCFSFQSGDAFDVEFTDSH